VGAIVRQELRKDRDVTPRPVPAAGARVTYVGARAADLLAGLADLHGRLLGRRRHAVNSAAWHRVTDGFVRLPRAGLCDSGEVHSHDAFRLLPGGAGALPDGSPSAGRRHKGEQPRGQDTTVTRGWPKGQSALRRDGELAAVCSSLPRLRESYWLHRRLRTSGTSRPLPPARLSA